MLAVACAVLLIWSCVLLAFGAALRARWREPAFVQPIVIFESDDWGAGPVAQAPALRGLHALLRRYTNRIGEHPVMTLGVILATPTHAAVNEQPREVPLPITTLAESSQQEILSAMQEGEADGVFALQLHGFVHFNAEALTTIARRQTRYSVDTDDAGLWWSETLPSEVQSAWIDGSSLPSAPLATARIREVADREGTLWLLLFGRPPLVAVPTTFIWSAPVEQAWAAIGVRWLVTPGVRYGGRDATGKPANIERRMYNGEQGAGGVRYVVRDLYFEPSLGHTVDAFIEQVWACVARGRPALVEIHRFNFCGPRAHPAAESLLCGAIEHLLRVLPQVRFMSTAQLGERIMQRDPDWIALKLRARLRAFLARVPEIPRFRKIACLTGLCVPLWLCQKAVA